MEAINKLYDLSLTQAKTYLIVALLITGNILLPMICHIIPNGGVIFLPVYFFTLLGACKYGIAAGMLTAIISPLLSSILTGMPSVEVLPPIIIKSCLIALIAPYAAKRFGGISLLSLTGVVLTYQIIGGIFEWAITGSFYSALQDFRLAYPGMVLQVVGIYVIIKLSSGYDLLNKFFEH